MLEVTTPNPKELLIAIKDAVDAGRIEAWSFENGDDLTHTSEQWWRKAWMRPSVTRDTLRFGIVAPRNTKLSKMVYAVYHGRLAEMLLGHFDGRFSQVSETAKLQSPDIAADNPGRVGDCRTDEQFAAGRAGDLFADSHSG